jgi:hypothetical protein
LRCFKSRFGLTGGLVYQYADGRFRRDEESYAVARAVTTQLTEILKQNPGITGNRFDKLASSSGIGREKTRAFLRDGVEFQQIQKEPGPRNSGRYYLKSAEHPPRCGKVGELNSEKDFAGELANCDELKAMP